MKDGEEERNGKAMNQEEQTKLPMAVGPAVLNSLSTNPSLQTTSVTEEPVQYAAVRKPLKKTYSLPECKCGTEIAPPGLEVSRLQAFFSYITLLGIIKRIKIPHTYFKVISVEKNIIKVGSLLSILFG